MLSFEECLNEVRNKKSFDYREETYYNIINSMEKQNPRKVDVTHGGIGLCPRCKTLRHSYEKYCYDCGQRLEWNI